MVTQLSQLWFMLLVCALVAMLTRRMRVPYTAGLVLAGIGLDFLPVHFQLQLSKDLIFSIFLPPLVFEAALQIRWEDLRRDLSVVILLATVGLILAAAVTAVGMQMTVHWGWAGAIVFG